MLDRFEFILGEAITALRRNGWMTLSAVNTAAIALFVLGGLGYYYLGLTRELNSLPPKYEIKISVKSDTTKEQITQMAKDLRAINGVARVVFLPKDVEWPKWQKEQGIIADTADIENPLPDQFSITLRDLQMADSVKAAIEKHPQFEPKDKIRDADQVRHQLVAKLEFVRWAGIVLGFITFFTAGTLILNAVHLTVLARRQEIGIMRLVGASHGTIRWPFLLEGAMQGAIGGVVAGLLLWALSVYLAGRSAALRTPFFAGEQSFPVLHMLLFLSLVGMFLGIIAAAVSVRKYLKVAK